MTTRAHPWIRLRRNISQNRVLAYAVGFSLLFHLSMITIFRIVLYFPEENVDYFPLEIVNPQETRVTEDETVPASSGLTLPSLDNPFSKSNTLASAESDALSANAMDELPKISLPTLAFAELERLEATQSGLRLQTEFRSDMPDRATDSWSRFGEEVASLRGAMSRLAASFSSPEAEIESPPAIIEARPAPGFVAQIDWLTGENTRELIYAPPLSELWDVDPSLFDSLAAIIFKVNVEGKVVEVLTPIEDERGLVSAVARQLLKYRFEPTLGESSALEQQGTLVLRADPVPSQP